ncbi:MAG: hypothetical protein V4684_09760 [Pseudomonadota bacterium]
MRAVFMDAQHSSVSLGLYARLPSDRAPAVDLIAHEAAQLFARGALQVEVIV